MAVNFRRTKLERIVKQLEDEITDIETSKGKESDHGMILYYGGMLSAQSSIVSRLKREFKLEEDGK